MVLQLPLELLQKIFLILVDLCLAQAPSRHSSGRPDWITITYVCRYWRSAALGIPELWSYITQGLSVSWSRAMIKRSAPLPMHIDIKIELFAFPERLKSRATSKLLCASRIRTLKLSGPTTDVLEVLHGLCSPSPLESLILRLLDTRIPADLPEALCSRDGPRFHHFAFESSMWIRVDPSTALASLRNHAFHYQCKNPAARASQYAKRKAAA
jgi:hypothetical protein